MASNASPIGDGPEHLGVDTRVEVRNAFDGTWSRGFAVIAIEDTGYRIRRRSDDCELPATIAAEDVRPERARSMWWI